MTIALYYSPGSCSLAPHIVLNEVGQPFELRRFATADRANYSPEYLAVNPKGRIPALQIDGFILTENPAILAYLGTGSYTAIVRGKANSTGIALVEVYQLQ